MNYYIKYFGCDMNRADAERVSSILESQNFKKTETMIKADIVVVIACSVRQSAIDRVYGIFHKTKLKKRATTILTGCVLDNDIKNLKNKFDIIIDITKIKELPKLIEKKNILDYSIKDNMYLEIESTRFEKSKALIPISNGCNQFCTYCAVPYTRGREMNRSAKNILKEIKNLDTNAKQIVLLGQTVNSYINPDKKSKIKDFADLLEQVAIIRPEIWISFLSSHPIKFNEKLIKIIAKHDNISKHIHLPLQSGSDKILKLMNRKYSKREFIDIIENIYKEIPNANITTDVIVGFPGETKKDFKDTLDVLKKCNATMVYSGLYSPRHGTVSAKKYKDNINISEKRKRDEEMTRLIKQQSKKRNESFLNTTQKVLLQNIAKNGDILGKTNTNETVRVLDAKKKDLDKFINVYITKALEWGLEGEVKNIKTKKTP